MENVTTQRVLHLSDAVIARIAQIVQEGMLMGADVVDLLRQVEIVDNGTAELQLNAEYLQRVLQYYSDLETKAAELQSQEIAGA